MEPQGGSDSSSPRNWEFQQGNPPTLIAVKRFAMTPAARVTELWEIAAQLVDGTVYHYWFEVQSTNPDRPGGAILCADPTLEWRLLPVAVRAPLYRRRPAASGSRALPRRPPSAC